MLLDLLDLLDDVLVGINIDYFIIVKKFDVEKIKDIGFDVLLLIGFFLIWFDCIQDDVCIVIEGVLIKFGYFVVKLLLF